HRQFGWLGEIGLDLLRLLPADPPDVIAPGCVLIGEGCEPIGRQVPQESAAPSGCNTRDFLRKPPPLDHRTHAEAKIEMRVAPARIDPGPRGASGEPARLAGIDDCHPGAGARQVIGDRGSDDPGAHHNDFLRHSVSSVRCRETAPSDLEPYPHPYHRARSPSHVYAGCQIATIGWAGEPMLPGIVVCGQTGLSFDATASAKLCLHPASAMTATLRREGRTWPTAQPGAS